MSSHRAGCGNRRADPLADHVGRKHEVESLLCHKSKGQSKEQGAGRGEEERENTEQTAQEVFVIDGKAGDRKGTVGMPVLLQVKGKVPKGLLYFLDLRRSSPPR